MERERYSVYQQAAEVAGNSEGRMQRAEALALCMAEDITRAHDSLLQEDRAYGKTRLGYNLDMDSVIYKTIVSYRSTDPLEHLVYWRAKEARDKHTRFQLETHLGERFNVLSSKYRLNIQNGEIWSQVGTEPFRNMLIRGRDYRAHHGSTETEREYAEVDGFIYGQEPVMCDPETPVGTIMLSISPRSDKPGSIYQHNFYDMYILRKDENGRYIEARRYSSALMPQDYVGKVRQLNPLYQTTDYPDDIFFLSHPIRITNSQFKSPEDVQAFLHKEHDYMSDEQFAFIKKGVWPYIDAYIQILSNNPYDVEMQKLAYRAVLNRADELWGVFSGKSGGNVVYDSRVIIEPTMVDIRLYGSQHVRQVLGACGFSGDGKDPDPFNTDPVGQMLANFFGNLFKRAYGVGDFGEHFTCPNCQQKAEGPIGNQCPGCHITKEEYAKKTNQAVCV